MNGFIQVNPLVEPWIWNECRLINGKMEDYEEIWNDTYRFVCNLDVPIFSTEEITSSKERGALSYSNMVCRKISDIHKLCIVAAMRRPSKIYREFGSHDANLDFTYEPTVRSIMFCVHELYLVKESSNAHHFYSIALP
jgi:hypothetical protein